MKKLLFLFIIISSIESFAASYPATLPVLNTANSTVQGISVSVPSDFLKMSIKEAEKLAGRKLKLKEKIVFKILQAKAKKEYRKNDKEAYSKRSKAAFILSILSLVTIVLVPLSVILAVISIILASKSLKANPEDRKAKKALGFSILALGIIVVGLMIWGIFISDGPFKLFIIN